MLQLIQFAVSFVNISNVLYMEHIIVNRNKTTNSIFRLKNFFQWCVIEKFSIHCRFSFSINKIFKMFSYVSSSLAFNIDVDLEIKYNFKKSNKFLLLSIRYVLIWHVSNCSIIVLYSNTIIVYKFDD